jgi:carotenoid cleavage dioxygenase
LEGVFYRNGPNPQFAPRDRYHPFGGDGMVHAFRVEGGRVSYRNRWVRTPKLELERAVGESLFGTLGNPFTTDERAKGTSGNVANTSIVWHAGRLLALEEGHAPFEIDADTLASRGTHDWQGGLVGPMTAHPKIDPETGELVAFGNGVGGMHTGRLCYDVVSGKGDLMRSDAFDGPYPAMVHDFIVTREHVVFPIFPATVDIGRAMKGGAPIAWDPSQTSRLGVMRRDASVDSIRWLEYDPVFVYHPMNAFEQDGSIVADMVVYDAAPGFPGADGSRPDPRKAVARLERWTIDPSGRGDAVRNEIVDQVPNEYPRIDDRFAGRRHRHGWYVRTHGDRGKDGLADELAHVDFESGRIEHFAFGEGNWTSEAVFVPRAADAAEGDGFVVCVVYRPERNASDFVVFEAGDVSAGPIATAHLDVRVPNGFHAAWRPLER